MKNISRRFAGSVTKWRNNQFLKARLKLTVYYTFGVFFILLIFNLIIYSLFAANISNNLEYEGSDQEENQNIELQVIQKAKNQLQAVLLMTDGVIVILVVGISYYLAGRTLKPIETVFEKQKKFVTDAAHELRTPLTVLKTGVEAFLLTGSNSKEYIKFAHDSLEEINFLSNLTNDLLFLARSENFSNEELAEINLSKIVEKQLDSMNIYAKEKDIIFVKEVRPEIFVKGKEEYARRLVANLIKNAIDYNKQGGKVIVSLEKRKKNVVLKVADTGIGISKENLSRIFDRFFKADDARSKNKSGAGIGLSIVKEIANRCGARINAKSKLGEGTEIKIIFS